MKSLSNIFILLGALWLACVAPANGAELPLGSDLQGLLDYAHEHNPALAAARYDAQAVQHRAASADALPDPVLRTEFMDVSKQGSPNLLPGQGGGTRYLLMQTVPWFGKRDLQREVADAQTTQSEGQVAASWSELAARIKTAYAMHYYANGSVHLAEQTMTLLNSLEDIAQTRYENGTGTQQDVLRVQMEKTQLQGELIALEMESHHTQTRLNGQLSRPVDAPLAEPIKLREMPSPAKLNEAMLLDRVSHQNPQLRIAEADIHSSEKRRELTYADRYPNFILGIAPTQRGSSFNQWDLMVELNIPLQQSTRRSKEDEAEAQFSASNARKQALLDQTQSTLAQALSALGAARDIERLIVKRLLPQAELTYQSALSAYETGKVEFAVLIDAQKQILSARQQQLKAQSDMQLRLADIERLLGEEL